MASTVRINGCISTCYDIPVLSERAPVAASAPSPPRSVYFAGPLVDYLMIGGFSLVCLAVGIALRAARRRRRPGPSIGRNT